ncbi:MRPP3 [Mytilus edulis]|uniref:MRPP3 n=1 Tax=Mytilus edulis TaxID=6550 RepID=A0A8S3UHM4_MYTED|nr:MRPP3 [Mytilus edulis]
MTFRQLIKLSCRCGTTLTRSHFHSSNSICLYNKPTYIKIRYYYSSIKVQQCRQLNTKSHYFKKETENVEEISTDKWNGFGTVLKEFHLAVTESNTQFTVQYFEDLESRVKEENHHKSKLFDNIVMIELEENKNLDGANIFLEYLSQKGRKLGIIPRVEYIELLGKTNSNHENDELIYSQFKECEGYLDILDRRLLQKLIAAFSTTTQWKKGLELVNKVDSYTGIPFSFYIPILKAALNNQDLECFISTFDMAYNDRPSHDPNESIIQEVLEETIDVCKKYPEGPTFDYLLNMLQKYYIFPNEDTANDIQNYLEKVYGCEVKKTVISYKGECKSCMRKMEHAEITKEEFQELRSVFLDRTLYEGDTFYWTSPEELKTFLDFLEKNGPFDIVIDNLNLIFSQVTRPNHHGSSFQKCQEAVDYFANKGKRVLVVTRKTFPREYRNANTFKVHRSTHDDSYMLFGALFSGYSCMFMSKDYFRDSKHRLGTKHGEIFQKWQRSRQVSLLTKAYNDHFTVLWPRTYDPRAQMTDDGALHIPFRSENNRITSYETPTTFLCAKFNIK